MFLSSYKQEVMAVSYFAYPSCSPCSHTVSSSRKSSGLSPRLSHLKNGSNTLPLQFGITSSPVVKGVSEHEGGGGRRRTGMMRTQASVAAAANAASIVEESAVPRLKGLSLDKVVPALKDEFQYSNSLQVPKLEKVVINCGIGEAAQNAKSLESTTKDISTIAGQRPVITRARKAIAAFKLRKSMPVGVSVTLRGDLMYSFMDRLINLALPRTCDFFGVNPYSFDGKGNFNLGLWEQSVFPEIKFGDIDQTRGMDISIVTSANTDKEGQTLLTFLGLPFRKGGSIAKAPVVRKKKNFYKGAKSGKRK